jgi:predicted TIM-barrel fold metal-dependent hydrolase
METAAAMGAQRLVVSHPEYIMEADDAQVTRLANLGVVIEHSLCMYHGPRADFPISDLVRWIDLVGPERTALGSDLGQVNEPLPIVAYRHVCEQLLELGISEASVRLMVQTNPAHLLGLDD